MGKKNKTEMEKKLIEMLDQVIITKDITYGEFNKVIPFGKEVEELRLVEEEYPDLGIARYGKEDEGISTISILASVTSVLIGKRLGVILQDSDEIDENKLILGFTLVDPSSKRLFFPKKEDSKEEDMQETSESTKLNSSSGRWSFALKCADCGNMFVGDSQSDVEGQFRTYHESINKKGLPLWIRKDGKDLMFGTKTMPDMKKARDEYEKKNLNESATWETRDNIVGFRHVEEDSLIPYPHLRYDGKQ